MVIPLMYYHIIVLIYFKCLLLRLRNHVEGSSGNMQLQMIPAIIAAAIGAMMWPVDK